MKSTLSVPFAALCGMAAAAPGFSNWNSIHPVHHNDTLPDTLGVRSAEINCASTVTSDDCGYLSSIGFSAANGGNDMISLNNIGGNVFHFHNNAGSPAIVVFWSNDGMFASSSSPPEMTFSLAAGTSTDIWFVDDGTLAGGFSAIFNHANTLNNAGQVWNTWGEWSTGSSRTFDVSREVDMYGSWMKITGNNGCNAEWSGFSQCCFTCSTIQTSQYNSCGDSGTYWLDNCYGNTNPGAGASPDLSSGGCTGWTEADVYFL